MTVDDKPNCNTTLSKEELKRQRRELNDTNIRRKKEAREAKKLASRLPQSQRSKQRKQRALESLPTVNELFKVVVLTLTILVILMIFVVRNFHVLVSLNLICPGIYFVVFVVPENRWEFLRTSRLKYVRQLYKTFSIYNFLFNLKEIPLTPIVDDLDELPGVNKIIGEVLKNGPDTYQKKSSNVRQIASLLSIVSEVLGSGTNLASSVVDLGAGKALYTRLIYEISNRNIPTIALDNREGGEGDLFYDPPPPQSSSSESADAPYTRVVCDVKSVTDETLGMLGDNAVAVTKHLCGGATDCILKSIGSEPLNGSVKRLCVAGCCHQKTKREEYCNLKFLNKHGLCFTHVGARGGVQDNDFKTLQMLISLSKNKETELREFEYSSKKIVKLLGFEKAKEYGMIARRVMEEGRMDYLRARGWTCELRRYCD
eukprot:CAMPEP_0118655052 /NCGR_PEP_ID=MMETSP0785-20121206/12716_1 /TAXON_ID=91992 /ORGANISM="Bolidomonas pacifica, Strain CCMP 1866" /LENGTH=427 /DNA_ID=CAMNT_0006547751 /DNA_START=33 /DNA_END=1313 /DNA_ORIENTATION=+